MERISTYFLAGVQPLEDWAKYGILYPKDGLFGVIRLKDMKTCH